MRYIFLLFLLFPQLLFAQTKDPYVPEKLKPWVNWVQEGDRERNCALSGESRVCSWPGMLSLDLNRSGGKFKLEGVLDRKGLVPLPGDKKIWPLEVKTGEGKAVKVRRIEGRPYVRASKGRYHLVGEFKWGKLPRRFPVGAKSALVKLKLKGKRIENPKFAGNSLLWLRQASEDGSEKVEQDTVNAQVFRKITDGAPFEVETRITLRVSGRLREENLGPVVPQGFTPVSYRGPLPLYLAGDDSFHVQIKAGEFSLTITALRNSPPQELAFLRPQVSFWPRKEYWVWRADELLRSVELKGGTPTDPKRTNLPSEWWDLPAYVLQRGEKLAFKSIRRGEMNLPPNNISLSRTLWLDPDGGYYSVLDNLSGTMSSRWRVNAGSELKLGRVSVDGVDQLITKDVKTGSHGVETRRSTVNISAESKLDSSSGELAAVGWDFDASSVRTSVNLPPGWSILGASGVDSITDTWIGSWNLLDLFLVLLIAIASAKLLSKKWGLAALGALVLSHKEAGAPYLIWINFLACLPLLSLLPAGKLRSFVKWYYGAVLLLLGISLIPFSYYQLEIGLFPHLEGEIGLPVNTTGAVLYFLTTFGFFAAGAVFAIWFIRALFDRSWSAVFRSLLLAVVFFVLGGVVVSFGLSWRYTAVGNRWNAAQTRQPGAKKVYPLEPAAVFDVARDKDMLRKRSRAYSKADRAGGLLKSLGSESPVYLESKQQRTAALLQVDPKSTVQTGYGLPSWNWKTWRLSWNGAVSRDHHFKLYLLNPLENLLLSLLRVGLVIAFGLAFLAAFRRKTGAAVLALLLLGAVSVARADDFPPQPLLDDLHQRLNYDLCRKDCISASKSLLSVKEDRVLFSSRVHSSGAGAWPLPGPYTQFLPEEVKIDGARTVALRRDEKGFIWIRIPDGIHNISASGRFVKSNTVTLQFELDPGHFGVQAAGWLVDGISETGSVDGSIQLVRTAGAVPQARKESAPELILPDWYVLERRLELGVKWRVVSTLSRIGSVERPEAVRVPLLKGESVTSRDVETKDGQAVVTIPRSSRSVEFVSSLKESADISLNALERERFTERWSVECSAIWRCTYKGITPTLTRSGGRHLVRWNPFPGEEATVSVQKPKGASGRSITVKSFDLDWRPGVRILSGSASIEIRSSRGGWVQVSLPRDSKVQAVKVNGKEEHIRPESGKIKLPVVQGNRRFQISFRVPWEQSIVQKMPALGIDSDIANSQISVKIPRDRWLILTGGPALGPVVLFWGKLLAVVLAAFFLGCTATTPLRTVHWILLGVGLASLHPVLMVVPVVWLFLLGFRRRKAPVLKWRFNSLQVFLALLTLTALITLYIAVQNGLILYPDMQVRGNGSGGGMLRWYEFLPGSGVPQPWFLSCPLWAWRIVMLVWSSWLVFSLIRWLKWGWQSFSFQGIWR